MFNLAQIFRRHLDLKLHTADGLIVRIIERPKLSLTPEDLAQLIDDLKAIAKKSLKSGPLEYGIFDPSGDRLEHSVITLIKDQAGTPIAFNALTLMQIDLRGRREVMMHLGLVLVDPTQRSKGMSWILYGLTCVILFLRNQMRPIWISNVTQVPAIIGMVTETFVHVFPTPDLSQQQSFQHLSVAREIMKSHRHVFGVGDDAGFDEKRFIITNAYTGGSENLKKSFPEAAKHRVEAFNTMCSSELNYDRGDDFLQIAMINAAVITRFLVKDVPRNAVFQVVGWFFLALLNAVVLPAVQWFYVQRRLGHLRPRIFQDIEQSIGSEASVTERPKSVAKTSQKSVVAHRAPSVLQSPHTVDQSRFDYLQMTTRNIGFVTPEEQTLIRKSRIFIAGVGGMGGACLQSLVRSGVEDFVIADMDTFEISNLNRQVFASMPDVGQSKVAVTCKKVLEINPFVKIESHGPEWVDHLDEILSRVDFVINGMDDIAAGIHLYRRAFAAKKTIIDAYAAPLPSVTVVRAADPRPEERLKFQTSNTPWRDLSKDQLDRCKFREMLFVFANSTSVKNFHMQYALEVFQGKRSRPSFAPMVITTGNLMAFEALRHMMRRRFATDFYGYFFNPWSCKVEVPYRGVLGTLILKYAENRLQETLKKSEVQHD